MIPKKIFFTKGVGVQKEKLASFEQALRKAGIEKYNLVKVSSIMPPNVKAVTKEEGLKILQPGQILFVVMSENSTDEPNRLISASLGIARPAKGGYGYLSEHHAYGQSAKVSGDYAEDLAATMLATTLGIEFDVDQAWDERKQIYKASGKIITTTTVTQSAKGAKEGLWTTVIAAAVFLIDE
ncbi:MAG: arginine decarboxylase, pyruvoyl-dependent [Candidatus Thermoplasmatota archaeon]|jgi:arginine decarboxylase|nr:arginine decarboxylase, pyruvoyl-dependent [Candidatus Thermoplasmatota archaeon]MDP7265975.1 arginine decarboxylase, pyruvoyl-dependent [Candidatus Thermoplasmatota archaeon]